jgi:hypothetical protein
MVIMRRELFLLKLDLNLHKLFLNNNFKEKGKTGVIRRRKASGPGNG